MISFKNSTGSFSFHFREVYQKSIEYIRKFFIQMREISKFWWYVLEEILGLISGSSLKIREGSYVCIQENNKIHVPLCCLGFHAFMYGHHMYFCFYVTCTNKYCSNLLCYFQPVSQPVLNFH